VADVFTVDDEPLPLHGVSGIKTGAASCGLGAGGPDIGVIMCESATATGTALFSKNRLRSPSVGVSSPRAMSGKLRGAVFTCANGNALLGSDGETNAIEMINATESALGIPQAQLIVASCGPSGVPLKMAAVKEGIVGACGDARAAGAADLAAVMMQCDADCTAASLSGKLDGKPFRIAGIARIPPPGVTDTAGTFAFIVTDVAIEGRCLREVLLPVYERTFSRLVTDAAGSTNDTLCVICSSAAGNALIDNQFSGGDFAEALEKLARRLLTARSVSRNGRVPAKLIEVRVARAGSDKEADASARAIAGSFILRSAIDAGRPDWAAVLAAAGHAQAKVKTESAKVRFCGETVYSGAPVAAVDGIAAKLASDRVTIEVELGAGSESATAWAVGMPPGNPGPLKQALQEAAAATAAAADARQTLAEAEKRVATAEAAGAAAEARLAEADAGREGLLKNLADAEAARADTDTRLAQMIAGSGELEKKLAGAAAAHADIEKRLAGSIASYDELQKKFAEAGTARANLEKRLADSTAGAGEFQKKLADASAARADLEKRLAGSIASYDEVQKRLAEAGAARTDLEKRLADSTAGAGLLQKKLADASAARADIEKRLAGSIASCDEVQKKLAEAGTARTDLEKRLADSTAGAGQLQKKLAEAGTARADLEKRLAEAVAAAESSAKQLESVEVARAAVQAELARTKESAVCVAQKVEEKIARIAELETEAAEAKAALEKKHDTLSGLEKRHVVAESARTQATSAIVELKKTVAEFEAKVAAGDTARAELEAKLTAADAARRGLEEKLARANATREAADKTSAESEREFARLRQEAEESHAEADRARATLDQMQQQIQHLRTTSEQLETKLLDVKTTSVAGADDQTKRMRIAEGEIVGMKSAVIIAKKTIAELEQKLAAAEETQFALRASAKQADDARKAAEKEVKRLNLRIESIEKTARPDVEGRLRELEQELTAMEVVKNDLARRLERATAGETADVAEYRAQAEKARSESARLRTESSQIANAFALKEQLLKQLLTEDKQRRQLAEENTLLKAEIEKLKGKPPE
jgi:N-acetylglutamate synthase/N-acetylornithine aminotransferase/DNA repair exonuclease SbcCD ATPase subunit